MLDAVTAHPMLKRKRRRRRVDPRIVSRALVAAVALALVAGLAWWATRPAPADARALLVRSLVAMQAGDWHAAADEARAAAHAQPSAGIAHALLARAELELDHGVAADAALGRAVAVGLPASRLHQLVAHARLLQGDTAGAIDEAGKAAAPYAAYATRIRARALAADQPAAARALLEALVAAATGDGEAWADLARLQFTQGDLGGATRSAAQASRLLPREPRVLTLTGELVRARYGLRASLPWFEAALTRDARYHPALIEYAATLGEAGRSADMLAALRRASAVEPGSPEPFYLQAVLAARAGKLDLAGALLERGGGVPGATLLAGAIDYAGGRYQQAVARWSELSAAQPMNLDVRRLLAAAMLRGGDASGALTVLRPLVVRADADTYSLLLAARAFEATGNRASAAIYLDRAAEGRGAPAAFAANESVGTLAFAAAANPADPTYAIGLIRGLLGGGDAAGATASAQALARGAAGAPAAQLALGDVLAATGRDPTAAYARAADLRFDEPTMLRLVDAQGRGRRPREAAATLALFMGQNPQDLAGARLLGHLQVEAGEWSAAVETLEGVRRRTANADVALLVDLALAYAGDGEAEVAVRYARAAYVLSPINADAADAYGLALAAAGQTGGARQLLDKAVALAPDNRAIAAHRRQLG